MAVLETRRAFAAAIDEARKKQHLSIRDVARIADVPAATAQGWLNARHFPVPALRRNYLQMVEAVGLADQIPGGLWEDGSLSDVQPQLRGGRPPYLGLRPFGAGDRDLFFGRDGEAARLARLVLEQRRTAGAGMIIVLGASGSGKSSLLAAGLLGKETGSGRALAGWSVAQLAVADLTRTPAAGVDLAVVDQFEEAFALGGEGRAAVMSAVKELASRAVVVLGLRADAFSAATEEPALVDALEHPFLVSSLTHEEARQVVLGPAELVGVQVEEELVPVLLDDLPPGPRPGTVAVDVLPLLSNALLVTWAAGKGNRMTLGDYARAGGVASAVQGLAEEVFQALDPEEQDAAQRLFLRLTRSSADVLVREALPLDDIDPAGLRAMDAFVAARMLTVSSGTVRISHDALLSHWPRIASWISENRADLAVIERLRRAAQVWNDSGRTPEALIPVDRLEIFSAWVSDPVRQRLLSRTEADFLHASRNHFGSVLRAEQVVNRRLRRGRARALALSALAVVLALITGVLYVQGRGLERQAIAARSDAQSRQVALEARSIRAEDPNLMAQMSLVAAHLADTRQAQSALLDATSVNTPVRWLGAASAVVARSADEKLVARANGSGEVTLWRGDELLRSPGTTFTVDPTGGPLYSVALATAAGRTLLAVGGGASAGLWDVTAGPVHLADLRDGDFTTYGLAFSADGRRLAVATSAGDVRLWTTAATPTRSSVLRLGAGIAARAVAFSPTSGTLFVAGPSNAVARWDVTAEPRRLSDLTYSYGKAAAVSQALAVSPDGTQLAAGIAGRRVPRWALEGDRASALDPLVGFDSWTNDVSYSRDGSTLVVANSDQHTYLYDTATGTLKEKLDGATLVTGAEMVAGRPVTTGADGTLRVWQSSDPVLRTGSSVYALSTDPQGAYLAASTLSDGIGLWATGDHKRRRLPDPDLGGHSMSSAVAVAPSGRFLLGGTTNGKVLSWTLTPSGAGTASLVDVFPGSYIGAVAISPDSRLVAILQYTGRHVALFHADDAGRLTSAATLDTPTPQGVTFSPDASLLAVPIEGAAVQLWDVRDPGKPKLAGRAENLGSMPTIAAFSSHAPVLAVGTEAGEVSLWDVSDPARPHRSRTFGDPHSAVYGLAFSPDDRTLAAVGGDELVWAWRLDGPDAEAYLALDGGMGRTYDVRFLDGGEGLVVGGEDGTLRTWAARVDLARKELCASRGEPLTSSEWSRYLPGVVISDPC